MIQFSLFIVLFCFAFCLQEMVNVLLAHLATLRNLIQSNNSSHNVGIGRPHASRSMYSRLVDRMSLLQYKAPSCHTVLIQYTSKSGEEPGNESACNSSIASDDRSVVPKLLVVGWCLQPGLLCLGRNSFLAFSCKSLIHNTSYWCLHNIKST